MPTVNQGPERTGYAGSLALLFVAFALLGPAVAAAGGWYLMRPPVTAETRESAAAPSEVTFHYYSEIRVWRQERAFDSAAACETEKAERESLASQAAGKIRDAADRWGPRGGMGADIRARRLAIARELLVEPSELEVQRKVLRAEAEGEAWRVAVCIANDDPRLVK